MALILLHRKIGKSSQRAYLDDGFLIDFLTPEEYFEFIGKISDMNETDIEARIKDFERFMNGEILEQKKLIRDFSAGNKQKNRNYLSIIQPSATCHS